MQCRFGISSHLTNITIYNQITWILMVTLFVAWTLMAGKWWSPSPFSLESGTLSSIYTPLVFYLAYICSWNSFWNINLSISLSPTFMLDVTHCICGYHKHCFYKLDISLHLLETYKILWLWLILNVTSSKHWQMGHIATLRKINNCVVTISTISQPYTSMCLLI